MKKLKYFFTMLVCLFTFSVNCFADSTIPDTGGSMNALEFVKNFTIIYTYIPRNLKEENVYEIYAKNLSNETFEYEEIYIIKNKKDIIKPEVYYNTGIEIRTDLDYIPKIQKFINLRFDNLNLNFQNLFSDIDTETTGYTSDEMYKNFMCFDGNISKEECELIKNGDKNTINKWRKILPDNIYKVLEVKCRNGACQKFKKNKYNKITNGWSTNSDKRISSSKDNVLCYNNPSMRLDFNQDCLYLMIGKNIIIPHKYQECESQIWWSNTGFQLTGYYKVKLNKNEYYFGCYGDGDEPMTKEEYESYFDPQSKYPYKRNSQFKFDYYDAFIRSPETRKNVYK